MLSTLYTTSISGIFLGRKIFWKFWSKGKITKEKSQSLCTVSYKLQLVRNFGIFGIFGIILWFWDFFWDFMGFFGIFMNFWILWDFRILWDFSRFFGRLEIFRNFWDCVGFFLIITPSDCWDFWDIFLVIYHFSEIMIKDDR